MRVFIAIELDKDVKRLLNDMQQQLNKYAEKANNTSVNNFHLTLRFIGEVEEKEISKIKEAIDVTASKMSPFLLSLENLGHFSRKHKDILWIGVTGERSKLTGLKGELEENLVQAGFSKEKNEYIPHITLARQVRLNKPFGTIQEEVRLPKARIGVRSISLMESTRMDGELVYRPIYVKQI